MSQPTPEQVAEVAVASFAAGDITWGDAVLVISSALAGRPSLYFAFLDLECARQVKALRN